MKKHLHRQRKETLNPEYDVNLLSTCVRPTVCPQHTPVEAPAERREWENLQNSRNKYGSDLPCSCKRSEQGNPKAMGNLHEITTQKNPRKPA
jgi:hypothetical protein